MADPESYTFLATGRIKKLENRVLDVLNLHDIKFKPAHDNELGVYCNTGGETFNFKKYLFEKKIRENPKVEELIMFDDRQEHLHKFVEWRRTQPIQITIIDVINKKTI